MCSNDILFHLNQAQKFQSSQFRRQRLRKLLILCQPEVAGTTVSAKATHAMNAPCCRGRFGANYKSEWFTGIVNR
jgi:hypothetical protein